MKLNSRKCLMMGADVAVVLVVFAIISLLFGYTLNLRQIGILIFVIVLQETLFVVMGIYTILWRYAEVLDYFRLGCICLFSGVVFFICDVFVAEPRYGGLLVFSLCYSMPMLSSFLGFCIGIYSTRSEREI